MGLDIRNRNLVVDSLSVLFGVGAWMAINGLWVELPLLVQELPEGWSLPSYMSIVTQMANIGPITYTLLRLRYSSLKDTCVIYVILCIGCTSSLLIAMFWDVTTVVNGAEHSVSLLSLVFFLALVDCTSSVLYIPYMAVWRDIYLPSYLIGEGLSGLLPAIVALGQGVGGNVQCVNLTLDSLKRNGTKGLTPVQGDPNFSIDVFFYILFSLMVVSSLSFILLERLPSIQTERSTNSSSCISLSEEKSQVCGQSSLMSSKTFIFLLFLQCWSSMLSNGLIPSIQSYSCDPYGNVTYHLAAVLAAFANPIAAFSTMVLKRSSPKGTSVLCGFGTCLAAYIFATGVMSPMPPLMGSIGGSILIILVWVAFVGIITYVRVEIANFMREIGASHLLWSGIVTQIGSLIGATVAFILVNNVKLFKSYNPCE